MKPLAPRFVILLIIPVFLFWSFVVAMSPIEAFAAGKGITIYEPESVESAPEFMKPVKATEASKTTTAAKEEKGGLSILTYILIGVAVIGAAAAAGGGGGGGGGSSSSTGNVSVSW